MKQQINLYQERFRARRVVLPARTIAVAELVTLVAVIMISVLIQWSVHHTEATRTRLSAERESLQQRTAQLRQAVDRQSIDKQLETRVNEANKELMARTQVLEWVAESQERNSVTFSALLEGPGRRHVSGLWLSRIKIGQAGSALQLTGDVLDPELVPEFLTALQQEPAYVGREFRKLILEANEDAAGMRFLLTTMPPEQDGVTLSEWRRRSDQDSAR